MINKLSVKLILILLIPFIGVSQEVDIIGKIIDSNNRPLEFVNAIVFTQDSTFVKGTVTDGLGEFKISSAISFGSYIKLQSLGFKEVYRNLDSGSSIIEFINSIAA